MPENVSFFRNRTELGQPLGADGRPVWAVAVLASVLIFTTVVDVLGNLLGRERVRERVSQIKPKPSGGLWFSHPLVTTHAGREEGNDSGRRLITEQGNVFVVSLAFADLVVAFYPYPLVLYAIFHDGWALGDTQCKVSGFLMGLSVIGSIFNITGIAINRYCYICHSLAYDKLYSYRNTLLFVGLIWVLTVIAIIPNFFVGSLRYDPRVYSCTFAQTASSSYTVAVVVIHFLVPIAVVTFCYLRIWILVIQVRRKVKSEVRPRLKPSDLRNFITMFVVFVLFAICWAPLNLIGLAVAINPPVMASRIPEWLFVVSYFMAYFNSCLNAIIYGLLNRNFRKEYKRIVTSVLAPRLFHTETSRGVTEGLKSKPSPGLNNNEDLRPDSIHLPSTTTSQSRTVTTSTESPRLALPSPTPRWRTAAAAPTQQLPSHSQRQPVSATRQDTSHTLPPTERVFRKEPKMPAHQKGEDIEKYLLRFEHMARTWAWPEREWAYQLVPLLTGKALEPYTAMDEDKSNCYDDLKEVLLEKFDIYPETYHQHF
ncbi:hypothetical protein JZ751_022680 [Albula glossodonta]|uniref:G-protein coupled receptors family 1 profile domain-containing protein n=1 Tax=Albula glossodonta TaxID=121402 RepID=A0A8T2PGZ8_9TELE|nr:hypothetical protein JZ751_022680 [Albula glossodonta]